MLVFQYRVMSLDYFMDNCTDWELSNVIENIPYLDRNTWEGFRLNAYINAQTHSKKTMHPSDIIKFKWDDDINEHNQEISKIDIERLKQKAKQWEG